MEEEADETCYWLEILVAAQLLPRAHAAEALQEANEIVAMTVAFLKTLRAHQIQNPKSKSKSKSKILHRRPGVVTMVWMFRGERTAAEQRIQPTA